jgi:hypothetical protein
VGRGSGGSLRWQPQSAVDRSGRMLKKSASGVLTSLRGSTYRSVRLPSSLAAALLDGIFEHPAKLRRRLAPKEAPTDMTNSKQIETYCSYFENQLAKIQKLKDRLHKKTLLLVILDTLGRARYPNAKKQTKTRFCQLVKEHIRWQDGLRVSLYRVLILSPPTNPSKLRDFAHTSVSKWKDWGPLELTVDPLISDVEILATTDEERKLLSDSTHLSLLYAYRNHLIHEFREPGAGMELDQRETSPYYHPMTHLQTDGQDERESWELVYPLGFFVALVESCLKNLNHYLLENDLDPYSCYNFGTVWNVQI